MPLPDERPRQSVANLIGRFEQQNKRQSLPGASRPPIDVAKEDSKEKKEWPPKSVALADVKSVFTPSTPSIGSSRPNVPSPTPTVDVHAAAVAAAPSSPPSAKSAPLGGKAGAAGTSTPTPSAKRAPLSPLKSRPSTVSNSPVKSVVKTHTSKPSLSATPLQPLKPQHTGRSAASSTSVSRTPRATSKSVSSTPARPRTPASQPLGTLRPKTPSSGLFAPTAASLARSRIASPPPPVPPPVKKMTLSNSTTERLSKPTAASLSKARTPVPTVPSPPRVVKSTSTGSTLRGSSKLKTGLTPDRTKEAKPKEVAETTAPQSRDTDPSASEPVPNEEAVLSDPDIVEDMHSHADVSPEAVCDDHSAVLPDAGVSEELHAISEPAQELPGPPSPAQEDPSPEPSHVQDPVEEGIHDEAHEEEQLTANDTPPHDGNVYTNGHGQPTDPTSGNDIEDIVNMLETTSFSKSRPQSMITIPDEHVDTSDEA